MSHSTEAYISIQLDLSKDFSQKLTRLIDDYSVLPRLLGYFEVLYDVNRDLSDDSRLMLYFPPDEPVADVHIDILMQAMGCEIYNILEERVEQIDYLEAYKKHYTAFFITENIVIIPSWQKEITEESTGVNLDQKIKLYLDPGLAFGTGKHPTSRLCLEFLDQNRPSGKTIVDAGCGSGILSIGALLLGAKKVTGFDIDANALNATKKNIKLNEIDASAKIELMECGFDEAHLSQKEADLLIGNLTSNVIVGNKQYINSGLFNEMILSGILSEQIDQVLDTYLPDWELITKKELDGWVLLHLKR